MKNYVFMVYEYPTEYPLACLESREELSRYLGKTKEVVSSGLCRLKNGVIRYVRDNRGAKYLVYKVEL